jgi:hypothetical protein
MGGWYNKGESMNWGILFDLGFYLGIALGGAAAFIYFQVTGKLK